MALGAITPQSINPVGSGASAANPTPMPAFGPLSVAVINVVGDSSYPTGGSALTPQQLGFNEFVAFAQTEELASTGSNCASTGSALTITANGTALNLKCFANTGAEVANATNLSGITWQIIAWGV